MNSPESIGGRHTPTAQPELKGRHRVRHRWPDPEELFLAGKQAKGISGSLLEGGFSAPAAELGRSLSLLTLRFLWLLATLVAHKQSVRDQEQPTLLFL